MLTFHYLIMLIPNFIGKKSHQIDANTHSYRIAVKANSSAHHVLKNMEPKYSNVYLTSTYEQALEQLEADKVDMVFSENFTLTNWLKQHPDYERKGERFYDTSSMLGIVFKQNSPLRKDFNRALVELYISGKHEQIYNKYF